MAFGKSFRLKKKLAHIKRKKANARYRNRRFWDALESSTDSKFPRREKQKWQ